MPQFTYDPNAPGGLYVNTASSGFAEGVPPPPRVPASGIFLGGVGGPVASLKKPKKLKEPKVEKTKTATVAAAPGKTAAQKAADRKAARKKAADERKAAAAAAAAAERNPLTSSFKTPNEIRAEAARLAALGSVSEDSLRTESAAQQRDISGLSTALTGRLAGLGNEYAATLGGLTSQYGQLAGQAQSAGESAAAAAGAPTSIAPGASPTVATTMAALGAIPATYAPAAAMRGAMLGGEARAALTKALADRATKVSSDTAKYLYQLQQDEMSKAVAQSASEQNAARLAQSGAAESWNQQVDVARLGQGQQRIDIQAQRAAAQIEKDLASLGGKSAKKIQSAKDKILTTPFKWTKPKKVPTGEYTFTFEVGKKKYSSTGRDVEEAKARLGSAINQNLVYPFKQGKEIIKSVAPNNEDVIKLVLPILVNAGMKPKNARLWILKNILNVTPSVPAAPAYPTT
jgi:hypothetical protein